MANRNDVQQELSFRGLHRQTDELLDNLSLHSTTGSLEKGQWHETVKQTASHLQEQLAQFGADLAMVKAPSRQLYWWYLFFADLDNFDLYISALNNIHRHLETMSIDRRWSRPLLVHFRPTSCTYRWSQGRHGTRIALPAAMVTFADEDFEHLCLWMGGEKSSHQRVQEAMTRPPFRQAQAKLAGPNVDNHDSQGQHYNLDALFQEINDRFFHGRLKKPTLSWSSEPTYREFGHYHFLDDRITISQTLDSPDVPGYVLEHVMHHEMLHKHLGTRWQRGRQYVHTRQFKMMEKQYPHYRAACLVLNQLARKGKG